MSRTRRIIGVVCMLVAVPVALGQYAPGMDGRALDANNMVGSSGRNLSVSTFSNNANLYITGNVTGGRSFKGYSPIRDSSALFTSTPSSSIGTFVRDTVGLPQVMSGRSVGQVSSYYNPYSTVANTGAITRGLNAPGTSTLRSTTISPYQTYGNVPNYTGGPAGVQPLNPGFGLNTSYQAVPNSSIYTPNNYPQMGDVLGQPMVPGQTELLRQSPLFGKSVTVTSPIVPVPTQGASNLADPYSLTATPYSSRATTGTTTPGLSQFGYGRQLPEGDQRDLLSPSVLAPRLFGSEDDSSTTSSVAMSPLAFLPGIGGAKSTSTSLSGTRPVGSGIGVGNLASSTVPLAEPAAGDWGTTDPTRFEPKGLNKWEDLSAAVALLSEMRENERLQAEMETTELLQEQYDLALSTVRTYAIGPVETLAGEDRSRVNSLLAEAETYLRSGEYYKAVATYEVAQVLDSRNPMIRLGMGNALLAAGEYRSAIHHITKAIEDYPAIGYLNLDLTAFIPDAEMLDLRRARLEDLLESREDYQMRFLLGYMEYYSGLSQFGIANLERAALEAPEGSAIAEFPKIIKGDLLPAETAPMNRGPAAEVAPQD